MAVVGPTSSLTRMVLEVLLPDDFFVLRYEFDERYPWPAVTVWAVEALGGKCFGRRAEHRPEPCILVTQGGIANLRMLGLTPHYFNAVVLASEVPSHLREVVWSYSVRTARYRVLNAVSTIESLPPLLRGLVRSLLRNPTLVSPRFVPPSPVASVSQAAELLNCSRSHLHRVARESSIDIRHILDLCRLLTVSEIRATTGEPWDVIGRRCGYASGAGVNALYRRCTGRNPTEAGAFGPERVGLLLLEALRGRPEGADSV